MTNQSLSSRSLSCLFTTILAGIPAVSMGGCICPQARVVIPVRRDQIPADVGPYLSSRALTTAECTALCGTPTSQCRIVVSCASGTAAQCVAANVGGTPDAGPGAVVQVFGVECEVTEPCVGGRRPEAFEQASFGQDSQPVRSNIANYLANQAILEHASITAFARVVRELTQFGAPIALIHAARTAIEDEQRHADVMQKLAIHQGSALTLVEPERDLSDQRSVLQFAIENAVEGCVRETYAAMLAVRQAESSSELALRDAFAKIAVDETSHADLAWAMHEWAQSLLSDVEQQQVQQAMSDAVSELRQQVGGSMPSAELSAALGLAPREQLLQMVDALAQNLWN